MDKEVEMAKKALEDDLANASYVLDDPLGHAITSRKIKQYLYVCVVAVVPKPDCVNWLYELYQDQTEDEKHKFQCIIDSMANALYGFYDYLKIKNKIRL